MNDRGLDDGREAVAGRPLDARLFELFFGPRPAEPVPAFSSDLGAAWVLLQRLLRDREWVEVLGTEDGWWRCRVHDDRYLDSEWLGSLGAEAPTAPLAICRAALRVAESTESAETRLSSGA